MSLVLMMPHAIHFPPICPDLSTTTTVFGGHKNSKDCMCFVPDPHASQQQRKHFKKKVRILMGGEVARQGVH